MIVPRVFCLTVGLRNTGRWEIRPELRILANIRYKHTLELIKDYFGVGTIFYTGKTIGYRVGSVKDLISVIIPHFNQYPLLSTKVCTFVLWSKAISMMHSGEHKTKEGFMEMLSIH